MIDRNRSVHSKKRREKPALGYPRRRQAWAAGRLDQKFFGGIEGRREPIRIDRVVRPSAPPFGADKPCIDQNPHVMADSRLRQPQVGLYVAGADRLAPRAGDGDESQRLPALFIAEGTEDLGKVGPGSHVETVRHRLTDVNLFFLQEF